MDIIPLYTGRTGCLSQAFLLLLFMATKNRAFLAKFETNEDLDSGEFNVVNTENGVFHILHTHMI